MTKAARPSHCLGPPCTRCYAQAIPDGVEALILDFDGTLADTTPSHEQALRAALRPHGHDLDHDWYRRHVGLSIHDLLAALPGGRSLPHDEIVRASRTHLLATIHHITALACVAELLHAARRAGLRCAVASAASRILVHPGLEALGLRHKFAAVVTREDVTHGKSDPDLYLSAAQRLEVPPGRCLAVDDAPDGVASARAAGIQHVITVADGHLAPAAGETTAAPHATTPDTRSGTGPGSTPPRCTDTAR